MPQQQDSHSYGVLALMAVEAIVKNTSLNEVNVTDIAMYRRYIKAPARIAKSCRFNSANKYCDMPFCSDPKTKKIG